MQKRLLKAGKAREAARARLRLLLRLLLLLECFVVLFGHTKSKEVSTKQKGMIVMNCSWVTRIVFFSNKLKKNSQSSYEDFKEI